MLAFSLTGAEWSPAFRKECLNRKHSDLEERTARRAHFQGSRGSLEPVIPLQEVRSDSAVTKDSLYQMHESQRLSVLISSAIMSLKQ